MWDTHTRSCMRSSFHIFHAKWSLVFRSLATSSQQLKTALSLVCNNTTKSLQNYNTGTKTREASFTRFDSINIVIFQIVVDRKASSKTVDLIFMILATTFMLINTVNMGCQLDIKVIIAVFKKPIGPVVGVISQFICMPLVSIFVKYLTTLR